MSAPSDSYRCMDTMRGTEGGDVVENSLLLGRRAPCAAGASSSHITVAAPATAPRASGVELSSAESMSQPLASSTAAGEGAEHESEPDDVDLFEQVDSLVKPVSAAMLSVVALVGILNSSPVSGSFSSMMVYEEKVDDSTSTKLAGSFENAAIFIALIVGVTSLLFVLYKLHCTRFIYAWLITSVGMLLASFGGLVALCARARTRGVARIDSRGNLIPPSPSPALRSQLPACSSCTLISRWTMARRRLSSGTLPSLACASSSGHPLRSLSRATWS